MAKITVFTENLNISEKKVNIKVVSLHGFINDALADASNF